MANIRFNARHGLSVGSTPIDVIDSSGLVSVSSVPNLDAAKITSGTIDAARLPSFVDDVLEFANLAGFPVTGETGKIYVALDTNKVYRWSGSTYIQITSGAVDSVAGKTGIVTLVKGDVGLGNVDNTADSAKSVLEATRLTTARTLGGVSFNGTANINLPGVNIGGNQNTTGSAATLTTARTLTIGNTGKTFNGSANVSWTSAEIVSRNPAPNDTYASWGNGVHLANPSYPAGTGSIVASFVLNENRGIQLATSSFSENTPLQFRRIHTSQPNGLGAWQALVDNTSTQTIGGVKTFSSTISGNISGNAGTVTNGVYTTGDQSIAGLKTFTNPELRIGSSDTNNFISFRGTTGDGPGSFSHTFVGENLYGGTENSELILFKGNDVEGSSGPDRIRHIAANHLFQTYTTAFSGTFASIAASATPVTRMIIRENGNVGIGTATPTFRLVAADSTTDGGFLYSTGVVSVLGLGGYSSGVDGTFSLRYDRANGNITFNGGTRDTPVERMRIAGADGFVGIGTAAPVSILETQQNTTSTTDFTITNSNTGNNITKASRIRFRLTDSAGTRKDVAYITVLPNNLDSSTGGYLTFSTRTVDSTPTEKMRISADGKVGIGTTSPSNPLDVVYGSSSTDLTTGPGNSVSTGVRIFNTNSTSNAYSYLDFRTNTADTRIVGINKGANLSDFAILTDTGSGLVEGLRITSDQNVGIGTTTPGYKLEVNGSFAATTKSFVIPHPTKEGKKLRYGSLEGPENGVYVRGKLTDTNTIELPDYWTKLVDPDSITVTLTPIGSHQKLYVKDVSNNTVTVGNENLLDKIINCYYVVYGERCDVEKLEVEIDVS